MPSIRFPPISGNPDLDRWLNDLRVAIYGEGICEFLHGWLADDKQTVTLGTLPLDAYVVRTHIHVTEAFNSAGTDLVTIGWDSDADSLCTSVDVSTTGMKITPFGVSMGFNSAMQTAKAYYTAGGAAPTTGKALVAVEFFRVAKQVS